MPLSLRLLPALRIYDLMRKKREREENKVVPLIDELIANLDFKDQ